MLSTKLGTLKGIISKNPIGCESGKSRNLIDLCPQFRYSRAPVLFHLPERTLDRILESFPRNLLVPAYVENGAVLYGMDREAMKLRLPRWKILSDRRAPVKIASRLGQYIRSDLRSVPDIQLLQVAHVTGRLLEHGLISPELATRLIQDVLPLCLEKTSLSRDDLLMLIRTVRLLPITQENAVLFPMLVNFGSWFLERNFENRIQRSRKKREEIRIASRLPLGVTSYKQIFS